MSSSLHKKFFFITLSIIFLLLFTTTTNALGVVPSSQQITFEPGKTYDYKIKIINDGDARQVLLYTEGDLSSIMSLDTTLLDFKAGEKEQFVTVSVQQPPSFSIQGKIKGQIVARDLSIASGQVAASISVASKLVLVVPYSGTYAETKLYVGDFSQGKSGNFIVEMQNLGLEDVASAQVFLNVIDARSNKKITSLVSGEQRVPKKSKKMFTIPWTPTVPNGLYKVVATTTYDGKSVEDQKVFSIGSQSIAIEAITVNDFSLGGIAKFNLLLKNEWNLPIEDVYAELKVSQGSNLYDASTTQTVLLQPLESQLVNAYWDTNKVVPGSYELQVRLFYNGQVSEKTFPITVKQNSIETGFTGQVTGGGSDAEFSPIYLLVLLVLIVLIVNIILFKKLMKKK